MIELWTLILLIVVALAWIRYVRVEPFVVVTEEDVQLQACPTGFTSFYQADGTTLCCEGDILAKRCMGKRQCVLSGQSEGITSCTSMMKEMYAEKAKDMCPSSMPSYFEGDIRGCMEGPYDKSLTGPKEKKQPTCQLYATVEENERAVDSCANQKEMEGFPCFGKDCRKEIVSVSADKPAKIAVHFADRTGMQRTAYTRASLLRYLNAANPSWRDHMDLQKNINVAEVAKAYYVDHTMSQAEVEI